MPEDPTIELPEGEKKPWSMKQMVLYKMDRTLAIAGLIAIALASLFLSGVMDAKEVVIAVVGVLGGYVGGRTK